MRRAFFEPPGGSRFALRNVTAPTCLLPSLEVDAAELCRIDLLVENGRLGAVKRAGALPASLGPDLDGSLVLPGFVDCHTHLDKGHIWPRAPNPTGRISDAILATRESCAGVRSGDDGSLHARTRT